MGIAFVCFGFIETLQSRVNIMALGCILRFLQGMASAFVQTTCFTIATNDYPHMKEKLIGLLEAMTGLGFVVGPIIGSALYSAFGFKMTFIVYGGLKILLAIIIRISIPQRNQLSLPGDEAYPVEELLAKSN